jgi:hypothetical protein
MSAYTDVMEFLAEILTTPKPRCECGGELDIVGGSSICDLCGKKTDIHEQYRVGIPFIYNCKKCNEILVSTARWNYDYCSGCEQIFCKKCLTVHQGSCPAYEAKISRWNEDLTALHNQIPVESVVPETKQQTADLYVYPVQPEPILKDPPAKQQESSPLKRLIRGILKISDQL